jgi:enoyl-CoA hydratase/carnithine racemase
MGRVAYEKKDSIAYIVLDNPKVNAIDPDMVKALDGIWTDFRDDDKISIGILSGANNTFSAGFDIKSLLEKTLTGAPYDFLRQSALFGDVNGSSRTHDVWKPLICAMDGAVNGAGLWLSLATDYRIATPETTFGLGELMINFPVEFTGFIIRHMPRAIASELLLTGNRITAERAYSVGIINKVASREELMSEAAQIAHKICSGGPLAVRAMKKLLECSWNMDEHSLLQFTASVINPIVNSADTMEACKAFREKRKPVWRFR